LSVLLRHWSRCSCGSTSREAEGENAPTIPSRGAPLEAYLDFARSTPFWIAVLIFGLMGAVFGGLNLHLFLHFTDRGISSYQAASILSMEGAFALASKPLTGWLIDRYGARQATVAALAGCLIALIVLLASSSFPSALVAGALLGLSFGSQVPLQAALLSRLFGADCFARAYGSLRPQLFR
jgi:MFS family permease